MTRELRAQDDLNLPHDADPILYVPAQTWVCVSCMPEGGDGAHTSVAWVGNYGRCSVCGTKMQLADPLDKHIPSVEEQRQAL